MAKIRGRQPVSVQYYDSPCGEMVLASVGEALCLCDWNGMPCACRNKRRLARRLNAEFLVETSAVLEQAKKQLGDYFACRRKAFNIRCVLWERISNSKCGKHCSAYHTERL